MPSRSTFPSTIATSRDRAEVPGSGRIGVLIQAVAVSRLGSQLSYAALMLWATQNQGSGVSASLLTAVPMALSLATALFAGPLIDRLPARSLMIGADLVNGASAFLIAGTLWFFPDGGLIAFALILSLRALGGVATAVFEPSSQVLLPRLVSPDALMTANSRLSAAKSGSGLLGEAMSGVLFRSLGASGLLILDGLTYFVSATLLPLLKPRSKMKPETSQTESFGVQWQQGWSFIRGERGLLQTVATALLVNLTVQPVGLILAFHTSNHLKLEPHWYGIFLATFSVANLVSSLGAARWVSLLNMRSGPLYAIHILALGLSQAILCSGSGAVGTLLGLALMGLAQGPLNILIFTAIQTRTPTSLQGRVHSALMVLFGSATPLGMLLAGWAMDSWKGGSPAWFLCAFIACALAAVYAYQAKDLDEYLCGRPRQK